MFDESTGGDITNDPSSPLVLPLEVGATTLSATTGNADQEYVTVTVPEDFELESLVLDAYSAGGDVAFVGVQSGTTFTEPLDNSADTGNLLGYFLFGGGQVGTDILDNISDGAGAIGFDGALPAGDYTFALQQLGPSTDYTLSFNLAEVESEPPVEPPTGELPVVSFEAVPATISEEASVADRLLRLEFAVVGEIPEGGLVVLLENLFGITDQADSEAEGAAFEGLGLAPPFDQENNIIGIRLLENQAAIQLPMINDLVEETTTFEFQLLEGEGYVVDPDQNATLFTITDDNGGPGVGPTIGLSVSETNLTEGDTFSVNFAIDGEIPTGGIDVLVTSDESVAGPLGQFELSNLEALQLSGVSNLRPGDDRGQSFIATITEANASITLTVFDDIVAEEAIAIPFTLANGELYEVDPNAESVTLNIVDEPQPPGPTVGLTVDNTELVEGGDPVTLTISVAGEIPDGGLPVLINDVDSAQGGLRSLTEFDITNVTTTGLAEFPSPAEGDSGFFVTVTEPTATITLTAFDDGADEDEAMEQFNFAVIDGEAYEVDPAASGVTISIADPVDSTPGGDLPVVSLTTSTPVVTEDEQPAAEFVITVDGDIPDEGLEIAVGGDVAQLFAPGFLDGNVPLAFDPPDGLVPVAFTGTEVVFNVTAPVVTATATIFDDIVEEAPTTLDFEILPGEGFVVGEGLASVTIEDGASANPGGGPTVSLSVSDSDLEEGDEFTVSFEVDGEIPDGGLEVYVDGPALALSEFNIFGDNGIDLATDLVGLAGFPEQDGDAGGFVATLTENQASITLSVFDDGANEGPESLAFTLVDGEQYEVNSIATYDFAWTGQIAQFSVEGQFSYDASQSYEAGIVREEDLLSLEVSFFDPDGNLLRTYTDAQDQSLYPTVNFAFDTETGEILQDGTWDVDDNVDLTRNGFMLGEGNPDLRSEVGVQSGLAFWTRPADDKLPHLHVDDWADEFGFPIGYSSHEDVSFPTETVADLIETGKVGDAYLKSVQDSLAERGGPVVAAVAANGSGGTISLTINDFETVGTSASDILPGDDADNSLAGLDGDDILAGAGGNDLLLGGDGADVLRAGDGSDIAFGGGGDDIVDGQAGDDVVSGADGSDIVIGGAGNDTLMGVTGTDYLIGDSLSSGGGSDVFVYGNDDGTDIILDFEVGTDQIGLVEGELTFADLTLTQDGGNTLLTVTETSEVLAVLNNVEAAGIGEDSFVIVPDVSNIDEALALVGGESDIIGTSSVDVLVGTDGDDRLDGLAGDDTYTGGAGADQFVLALAQGVNTVTDFEIGVDQISLGGLTPEGVKLVTANENTLVMTNSDELLGVIQGVTGLDNSIFG